MSPTSKKQQHTLWFQLFDVLLNIVIILAIVGLIRTFLISPFQVEGKSMTSTLEHKEYIIINKLAYHLGSPDRGEIVVFRPPTDDGKHYVKRVIGVPGDKITIKDGLVYLQRPSDPNPFLLKEDYLDKRNNGRTFRHPPNNGDRSPVSYEVPPGSFFLMGDNRQGSLDSRSFRDEQNTAAPYVPEDNIKGRVWFVALPIKKIHALTPAMYDFELEDRVK